MMRSLQSRLIISIGLAIAVILIVSGSVLFFAVSNAMRSQFDKSLLQACHSLAPLIESDGVRVESEMAELELPQFDRANRPDFYQLFASDGRLLESSAKLEGTSLLPPGVSKSGSFFENLKLPDGRPGRLATLPLWPRIDQGHEASGESNIENTHEEHGTRFVANDVTGKGSPVVLLVARDTIEMDTTLSHIMWSIIVVTSISIAIGLIVSAWVARLGLQPLLQTSAEISRINGKSLDLRLELEGAPSEVRSTITAVNQMLDRIQDTLLREREFSANVAHELRTPLAGLRSTIEVTRSRNRTEVELQEAFQTCLAICMQTEAIVGNLLTLSRIDAGKLAISRASIDLLELIHETWKPYEARSHARQLVAQFDIDPTVPFETDREKLRLILRNLFDNAVSYSDQGSAIQLRCQQETPNLTRFSISNSTSGLKQSDVPFLFDRFWRKDSSRNQTGEHSGLGLALCRSLVNLLGGSIDARVEPQNLLTICFTIPGN